MIEVDNFDYVPTLNEMGYMTTYIDEYATSFIEYAKGSSAPVVDLGVAYGVTTMQLLKVGATVIANDLDERHLHALMKKLSAEENSRLKLLPGKLPEVYKLEDSSVAGVLALRCFHFLTPEEVDVLLTKIHRSLKPGGKFVITTETPYVRSLVNFAPTFQQRRIKKELWPGVIEDFKKYGRPNAPEYINLFDEEVLTRELKKHHFEIEKISYISRYYFPKEVKLDGKESIGAIAVKY